MTRHSRVAILFLLFLIVLLVAFPARAVTKQSCLGFRVADVALFSTWDAFLGLWISFLPITANDEGDLGPGMDPWG